MNGWQYEWVDQLPRAVRDLAIEFVTRKDDA